MRIETGIGLSTRDDVVEASLEAVRAAMRECEKPAVALVFITFSYPLDDLAKVAEAVAAELPAGTQVVGGTVNGLTYEEARYDALFANKRAVAVVLFGGSDVRVGVGFVPSPLGGAMEAGRSLAKQVQEQLGERASGGIVFGTGLSAGEHQSDQGLLDGIRAINPRLRLSGTGLSGGTDDRGLFKPGFAFAGGRVEKHGCALICFAGKVDLGFATANGMQPVGRGGFVTDSEGVWLKEIDGRPAAEAVLDIVAPKDDPETRALFEKNPMVMAIERGTTLATPDPEGNFYWCHTPIFFTPNGWVLDYFAARKGTALSLVKIDRAACMDAIGDAVTMLKEDAACEEFDTVIAFSCALRGFTLGADVASEDGELRRHVKAKHMLGIVANGEIGCYRHGRPFYTGWVYAVFGLA